MSLEQSFNDLSAAIKVLAAAIQSSATEIGSPTKPNKKIGTPSKPKKAADKPGKTGEPTTDIGTPSKPEATIDLETLFDGADEDEGKPEVSIAEVRAALVGVAKQFKPEIGTDILSRFGADRIPDLNPTQYADVVKKCKAVMNGETV